MYEKENHDKKQFRGYDRCAEYYDLFANNDDIPFFLEYAKIQNEPILDLACGTGRVTIPVAKKGYSIVGLESSQAMLRVAKQKVSKLSETVKQKVTLVHGDMTDFNLSQRFNLIIIPSSFGHCINKKQQQACLLCVNKHLSKKGKFILDLYPGEYLSKSETFEDKPRKINQDKMVKRVGSFKTNFEKQISLYKLTFQIFHKNKLIKEISEESSVAVLYSSEINQLLKNTGFKIINEYCDWKRTQYNSKKTHKRRILILEKNE